MRAPSYHVAPFVTPVCVCAIVCCRYMREQEAEEGSVGEEESGWKLVYGDVFR